MIPILTLFLVLSISVLVTRIATIALVRTGLSRETARFQALSAFSGSGFTTNETELVVNHPVRRRIILNLMLLGNAGIVTVLSTLVVTFVRKGESDGLMFEVIAMISGAILLWRISSSAWVDKHLTRWIERMLERHTDLNLRDYESLLRVAGDYRLFEVAVNRGDWLTGRRLCESDLRDVGILVLGITRKNGSYLGAPDANDVIEAGDNLLVYGRLEDMKSFDLSKGKDSAPNAPGPDAKDLDEVPAPGLATDESESKETGIGV